MARYKAKGTLLQYGGSPTTVIQVETIDGPTTTTEYLDVTDHDTSGNYRNFVASLVDSGEITFTINYDANDPTHRYLKGAQDNQSLESWTLVFPTSPTVSATFDGYVSGYQFSAPVDGKLQASLTIKIDGPVKGLGGES